MKKNLQKAKNNKKDEFYTKLSSIEREIFHYKSHFKDKVVYCNTDDPKYSFFWLYFKLNFDFFGLKKLIATNLNNSFKTEIIRGDLEEPVKEIQTPLKESNGDFRDEELIEILKESDIVVTNPPFSLFREYVSLLNKYDKKFIIIGNMNAISYKEIFKLFIKNKIWLGTNSNIVMEFEIPKDYDLKEGKYREENGKFFVKVPSISWFTNLEHSKRNQKMILYRKYNPEKNLKYDNYNAINVDIVNDIPEDYFEEMGVPITFLTKYNPEQFEIKGIMSTTSINELNFGYPYINGKKIYARIIIKRKNVSK